MSGDKAMDAGALALAVWYGKRVPHKMDEVAAEVVLQAAWPILSAGLRELHGRIVEGPFSPFGLYVCRHCDKPWPCATVRELDRIDKELGL